MTEETTTAAVSSPPQEHPSWCDPSECTADFAAVAGDEWQLGAGGQHRSAPEPLGSMPHPLPHGVHAALTQALAPWRTNTMIEVFAEARKRREVVSFHLPAIAGPLTALLGLLLKGKLADQVAVEERLGMRGGPSEQDQKDRQGIDLAVGYASVAQDVWRQRNAVDLGRCTTADAEVLLLRYALTFLISNGLVSAAPPEEWEKWLDTDLPKVHAADVQTLLAVAVQRRTASEEQKATGL